MASLTSTDTIVLVLVGLFTIRGAMKGFVWQALRTGGLVAGFLLATRFGSDVGNFLSERFSVIPSAASEIVGWGVVVVGTFVTVTLVAHLARSAVRQANLTSADRVFGALLGGALGLGIAALGFTLWASMKTDEDKKKLLEGSQTVVYMAKFVEGVSPFFPATIRDKWGPVLHSLDK